MIQTDGTNVHLLPVPLSTLGGWHPDSHRALCSGCVSYSVKMVCSVATTIAASGIFSCSCPKSILFQRHSALLGTNNPLSLMSELLSGIGKLTTIVLCLTLLLFKLSSKAFHEDPRWNRSAHPYRAREVLFQCLASVMFLCGKLDAVSQCHLKSNPRHRKQAAASQYYLSRYPKQDNGWKSQWTVPRYK